MFKEVSVMKKAAALVLSLLMLCSASALADVFTIVTDKEFRPFEYTDEHGDLTGIDVDILTAVAADQGFSYILRPVGFADSIVACQSGEADGMMAGVSITDDRKESGWIFSDGYFEASQAIAVKADADIDSFEDLKGQQVAVKIGTRGAEYARELREQYGFTTMFFEDSPSLYVAVIGGECAACFDDAPILDNYIEKAGMPMKLVEGTENDSQPYGLAVFSEDQQNLLDQFNKGLANIKANGKYDAIIAKYITP